MSAFRLSQRLLRLRTALLVSLALPAIAAAETQPASGCLGCHATMQSGFNPRHSFAANACTVCHGGNGESSAEGPAHAGLIPYPGDLANAAATCGRCHADRVASVSASLMHTGAGMVRITRRVVDGGSAAYGGHDLQSLGHGIADSMLRKQCASCHLGQPKTDHRRDATNDRGGGCLACHVGEYPTGSHPAITTRVSDARCFGCHSRSGRISLSYAGLAETDVPAGADPASVLRLRDGRPVERHPADAHYRAGMACIDCHTSAGLMGAAADAADQRAAVDIACTDCHANRAARLRAADLPPAGRRMLQHVQYATNDDTRFLRTAMRGTALWHVELRADGARLHTKNGGRVLDVPAFDAATPGHDAGHSRLSCAGCHSQWAPQCFGCHMSYDENGEQWDHVERRLTPGRWDDKRWDVRNGLPALGVTSTGSIEPFVPGMIMTVSHPGRDRPRFVRRYAPLSPHTTGKARSCASCHRSAFALGLGEGKIVDDGGRLRFEAEHARLGDGLPADAWTGLDRAQDVSPDTGPRPLNPAEMRRIIEADLPRADSDER